MEPDRLRDTLALHALNADYAHHLDHGEVDALLDLFTPDAVYGNGARRSEGHAALRAFFAARLARGRSSRHLCSGLRISFALTDQASGTSVCVSWAQDGPLPLRAAAPFAIADFNDSYARCADGRWRFRERMIRPVYVDPAVPPLDGPQPGVSAPPGSAAAG